MGKYRAKIDDQSFEINLSVEIEQSLSSDNKPSFVVSEFKVGKVELGILGGLRGAPDSFSKRSFLGDFWTESREDKAFEYSAADKMILVHRGGDPVKAIFDIEYPQFTMPDQEAKPVPLTHASFEKIDGIKKGHLSQVVFGIGLYFDIIHKENSEIYPSGKVIVIGEIDDDLMKILAKGGFYKPKKGEYFYDDLIEKAGCVRAPEERPFKHSEEGHFQVRDYVSDPYYDADIAIYEIGTNIDQVQVLGE